MSLVTVNGTSCSAARAQIPAWGRWWVDADLTEAVTLSGLVSVQFADVAMAGTVISGGPANGRASYRIVGGAGGWSATVAAKGYHEASGVRVSGVVGDAAADAGETLADVPATALGPHYARTDGPASRVLHELAPRAWYVDFAGVTRLALRPTTTYAGTDTRTRVDPSGSIVEIATEAVASLVPGVTVDGAQPATDVEWILDASRLTVRVWSGPTRDRRIAAFEAMIDALDPRRRYRGSYEFRVVTQSGHRLNLQPVRAASGLPDLENVPMRPGMAGLRATVQLGELVVVGFLDADPSRPFVFAHDDPNAPGYMPTLLELGDTPTLGVVRLTDTVQAGPFAGVTTGASTRVKAGL
jgi:hypothetical protein